MYRILYGNNSIAVRWTGIEYEDEWTRRKEVLESWGWEILKTGKSDTSFAIECTLRKSDTI
ncbi:hypothetical protein ASPWEDRAFT_39301 [Aspergillus wentii DTO 134E9]|uniref:Uncharacterized protein n=1 Tax=Aspergillus wentii DTO 134E9 TaxID=1073089 RepID=A0A1L9RRV3_ASPWE|nr:uncharacterized protein ASPWEDRAFT_39301 [Aspergillus wentii DTO 134E9]OJJ37578.1 hypothetical protein ASPWEDRAFT_39301 [Aspergillus wentii DTO 134E9]